jgi:hypothetical protein
MWWADIEVPNGPIDKNSQGPSACYPRRTFYPLSNDPSIRNRWITMTHFRVCLTRQFYSQASFRHYTHFSESTDSDNLPSHTSVTLLEAAAPAKLSRIHCQVISYPIAINLVLSKELYSTVVSAMSLHPDFIDSNLFYTIDKQK